MTMLPAWTTPAHLNVNVTLALREMANNARKSTNAPHGLTIVIDTHPVQILAGRFSVNVTLGSVGMKQLVKISTSVQCWPVSVVRMSSVKIRKGVICANVNKAFGELRRIAEVGDFRRRMIQQVRRLLMLFYSHFIKVTLLSVNSTVLIILQTALYISPKMIRH